MPGDVAETPEQAEKIARALGTNNLIVKAQIHAGGRGKGTFKNGFEGGVHLCKTASEVRDVAESMLGETLVTHQTGPDGKVVRKVLVGKAAEIDRELYFAILMDRAINAPKVVASTQGGVEIEKVAEETPEAIHSMAVDPAMGLQPFQTRKLAKLLGFDSKDMRGACKQFAALYDLFIKSDLSLLEVNPLIVEKSGEVIALDAKFNFDDNALFRHPEVVEMRDVHEEDPREVEACKHGLNYIGLDGTIGCLVNGAGLAMATMDIIKHYGGDPANFLDVGGGANEKQVTEAFKILLSDSKVEAILVNIFGGIMQCDIIAAGIIAALKVVDLNVPLVVRLEGTNVAEGKQLLEESGLPIVTADDLADAAEKVVQATQEKE